MKIKGILRDTIDVLEDYNNSLKRKQLLNSNLTKVRVSSHRAIYDDTIVNQTPGRNGIIGNTIFYNTFNRDYDFVINSPNAVLNYNKRNSFLLHIEPPSYIRRNGLSTPKILNKFLKVFTTDPELINKDEKRFVASPPFVHWHLGSNYHIGKVGKEFLIDYDYLKNVEIPEKSVNLSTINSNLMNIDGHKKRADFLIKLSKTGMGFNLYGGSFWSKYPQYIDNAPNGKWFPFSKSRYVLVIENEKAPYYWSEKFTDAILCFATPIYYGCTNISDFFPEGSYYQIDIDNKDVIGEIADVITSDFHEKNVDKLLEARKMIFEEYNMFSFMNRVINQHS